MGVELENNLHPLPPHIYILDPIIPTNIQYPEQLLIPLNLNASTTTFQICCYLLIVNLRHFHPSPFYVEQISRTYNSYILGFVFYFQLKGVIFLLCPFHLIATRSYILDNICNISVHVLVLCTIRTPLQTANQRATFVQ